MPDSPYNLTIALNVLNFLGPNLYSNIPAVLSEMVANAWDADATEVRITIDLDNDRLIIEDNGLGMSIEDMNDKYLRVGYQKRDAVANNTTPNGRHFMGRKGIGKLAIFSFAKVMKIQSNREGKKAGCVMNWSDVEREIQRNNYIYYPLPLDPKTINIEKGTRIVLSGLDSDRLSLTSKSLRKTLARRFTVIDGEHNFDVVFNGVPISHADRPYLGQIEFIWYLGADSEKYVRRCDSIQKKVLLSENTIRVNERDYQVRGWVGTVVVPSDIREDHNNTIAVFAHGKLVQEDILVDFQEAQAFAEYIVGDIEADFLDSDDEPDIVTADRQRVNQNDPRYQAVKDFIKNSVLRDISRNWSLWRLERDIQIALENSDIHAWYERLNKTNRTKAARLLGKVKGLRTVELGDKDELYDLCRRHFDTLKSVRGIPSMDERVFVELLYSKESTSNIIPQFTSATAAETSSQAELPSSRKHRPQMSPPNPGPSNLETPNLPESNTGHIGTSLPEVPDADTHVPSQAEKFKRTSPPQREVESAYRNISKLIRSSSIEREFKEIALNDLHEAQKAYSCEAYKACVVMLGAVLEGLMLAVIRKPEVLDELRSKPQEFGRSLRLQGGIGHPDYSNKSVFGNAIAERLTFESYQNLIEKLIPEIESMKVEGIQNFRNAIHPWKAIREPNIYGSYENTRAVSHIMALDILVRQILLWELK